MPVVTEVFERCISPVNAWLIGNGMGVLTVDEISCIAGKLDKFISDDPRSVVPDFEFWWVDVFVKVAQLVSEVRGLSFDKDRSRTMVKRSEGCFLI